MLTPSFLRHIESSLNQKLGRKIHIRKVTPVSGGSINLAAKIDTAIGNFFLKANDAFQYPAMFEKEARGLQLIKEHNLISVPEVVMTGEAEDQSFLILKFIESSKRMNNFWEEFGMRLARLHKVSAAKFGLEENNYIGSLTQSNTQHNRWIDFFTEERLNKQMQMALRSGTMKYEDEKNLNRLFLKFESIIPEENPSLIHGDLWSGNYMTGINGEPCIIDPAVYYGHREMDLSMTQLFGGFDSIFYESYNSEFPLAPGFEERIDIHNLYPLLVHVNLFGGGYVSQVRSIIKRFS
jgi:protein-ribulosamine 3-kinase